jgi:WD repeat-containing protein 35
MDEAVDYISKREHQRLWQLLSETALERLDFTTAEKGFVKVQDYAGLCFVKKLRLLNDAKKQTAAVLTYYKKIEQAQAVYLSIDRKDLAIEMRMMLGDWFGVTTLLHGSGLSASDSHIARAFNEIGNYYLERRSFSQAAQFFTEAGNTNALIECFTELQAWDEMAILAGDLPKGDRLLLSLGESFEGVGLAKYAADAYVKAGDTRRAVECCIKLNDWDRGISLAKEGKYKKLDGLLSQHAQLLLEKGQVMTVIQLYKKAGSHGESAKLLSKLAREAAAPDQAKQLAVLAALEAEAHRKKVIDSGKERALHSKRATATQNEGQGKAAVPSNNNNASSGIVGMESAMAEYAQAKATLDGLIAEDKVRRTQFVDVGWRSAEAYHFLMLAQAQYYKGYIDAAMKTALRLPEYEDILSAKTIFSVVALITYYNKHYHQCSRALTRLETMDDLSEQERGQFREIAFNIFTKHKPEDPKTNRKLRCPSCGAEILDWSPSCETCHISFPPCVASGKPISDSQYITCRVCKHPTHESEMDKLSNCALCHQAL